IILVAYLSVLILIFFIRQARQKGLNVIAYSVIAAGILSICTEGMISIFIQNKIYLGWSLIVMVSVFFIAIPLFYIHYRLKKATDLKRFFHI
ncbi:MAG TPA: zinc ribbon domain-containing protein, partial [Mariniphaga sp.]|nr:zinc ribbon domain-containing protein [Mariniphaga sp.]